MLLLLPLLVERLRRRRRRGPSSRVLPRVALLLAIRKLRADPVAFADLLLAFADALALFRAFLEGEREREQERERKRERERERERMWEQERGRE